MKFVDLVNVSATCKRFFMKLTSHKEYKRTVTISKRIFNFDDCYAEFLQNKMLDLMKAIQDKFKEEIGNVIFSIIYLKIKRISYELTPFRVFCHCFFCSRVGRSIDTCSICSRIFVGNSDVARKIDSSFVVTKNSLENLDKNDLMKYLNARSVALNLYYLVGNYGDRTENFNEIFTEIANTPFAVYVLFVQIYLRIYFNMVKPITEIVIENCLMNKRPSICRVRELKQKYENILFLLYCGSGKILLNYLNIIFVKQPFEHIFLTFRAGTDYNKNSLKILNLK